MTGGEIAGNLDELEVPLAAGGRAAQCDGKTATQQRPATDGRWLRPTGVGEPWLPYCEPWSRGDVIPVFPAFEGQRIASFPARAPVVNGPHRTGPDIDITGGGISGKGGVSGKGVATDGVICGELSRSQLEEIEVAVNVIDREGRPEGAGPELDSVSVIGESGFAERTTGRWSETHTSSSTRQAGDRERQEKQ